MKKSEATSHSFFDESIRVVEFNFLDNLSINDAEIAICGHYPLSGYAVNDICTALVSVESGSGSITKKGHAPIDLRPGDRVVIAPGEPYVFYAEQLLEIRYIATSAWTVSQTRNIDA